MKKLKKNTLYELSGNPDDAGISLFTQTSASGFTKLMFVCSPKELGAFLLLEAAGVDCNCGYCGRTIFAILHPDHGRVNIKFIWDAVDFVELESKGDSHGMDTETS